MLVDRVEASAIEVEIWQCLRESNMIWLQESWKEDHEKKDELNTSCKPPDETKAKKKRTKAWRFRKYQMERRNFVPRLRNVNVNLCFFRCFILLLWFMEIHYLDVTRGCVLAVLGYTYLNNMCIHMDNFLYGVLQSIADYGIETWKISWASSNDSVRASSLFCPTSETAVRDFEAEPLWHLWFDALHQRMTELQNDGGRVWVWEDVGNIF